MHRTRRSFRLEPLEPRTVLTAVHPIPSAAVAAVVASPAITQPAVLEGKFTGESTAVHFGPRFDPAAGFTGVGTMIALGRLHLSGFVDHPAPAGQANGQLVLTSARGTLVLHLDGPAGNGTERVAGQLHFVIQQGTSAFRGMFGEGTILVNGGAGIPLGRAKGALTIQIQSVTVEGTATESPAHGGPGNSSAPLPGAIIVAQVAGSGQEVAQTQSDASGHFALSLPPGTYLIVPLRPASAATDFLFPPTPQKVTIAPGHVVDLTFVYGTPFV
jgi:hypothetical protein